MNQPAIQTTEINIVYMDPQLTSKQIEEAKRFIYEAHARRPINNSVAVHLNPSGGVTVNVGEIVTMNPKDVAARFKERLAKGEHTALRLNNILCSSDQGAS